MKKIQTLIAAAAVAFASTIHVTPAFALTADQVTALRVAWGEGIVKIGKVFKEGGDYKAAAREHIKRFYAYGKEPILFKPTLASKDQFRGTFDGALSYFVGGKFAEDGGFAIAPYTAVRWENAGTTIIGKTGLAMGNYYFTKTDGSEVKVEYSFAAKEMDDGELKFVLHHSSLPYSPSK